MNKQKKVWLVTGVSSGLGKEMAQKIYQSGDIIVGTVRKEADKQVFEQAFPDRSTALIIDLENTEQIPSIVDEIQKIYGRIDVLVNNAGYGLWGLVEEVSEIEVRKQLNINFIAVWKMCQSVLPIMRKQRSGHIIQISSNLGVASDIPGSGIYTAGKFAMEGLSEVLAVETDSFEIKITLAELGATRTNFFGRSVHYARHKIQDYNDALGDIRQISKQLHGNQPGDPGKIAEEIIRTAQLEDPPFRLPLTQESIQTLEQKAEAYQQTIADWKAVATRVAIEDEAS